MTEHIRAAFEHRSTGRVPRGELWLGAELFVERQAEDCVASHIDLCSESGMDLVSIPVGEPGQYTPGYRLFEPSDIRAAAGSGLFVLAVLSGPFQRLTEARGLREALAYVARDPEGFAGGVHRDAAEIHRLVERCVHHGADAVAIADDMAYDSGLFVPRQVFEDVLRPSYGSLVEAIHRKGIRALFHSCGNISALVPDIVGAGFDGLSCQIECVDLMDIKQRYGDRIALLAGPPGDMLRGESMSGERMNEFASLVRELALDGGFVLASSSGIYTSSELLSIQRLYSLVDATFGGAEPPQLQQAE